METKKGDFPYESSLGGVRLMTSPLLGLVMHCPNK